jgi:hypothetical protein
MQGFQGWGTVNTGEIGVRPGKRLFIEILGFDSGSSGERDKFPCHIFLIPFTSLIIVDWEY